MANYRVYLLNAADCIFDCCAIERDSDDAAVVAAAHIIADNPAVEIWSGARRIAHLTAEQLGVGNQTAAGETCAGDLVGLGAEMA